MSGGALAILAVMAVCVFLIGVVVGLDWHGRDAVRLSKDEWRTVRQGLAYARIALMHDAHGRPTPTGDTRIDDWNRLDLSIARQVGEWR